MPPLELVPTGQAVQVEVAVLYPNAAGQLVQAPVLAWQVEQEGQVWQTELPPVEKVAVGQ